MKDCVLNGLVHGIANSLSYFQTAASFYVGAVLMNEKILDVVAVFRYALRVLFSKEKRKVATKVHYICMSCFFPLLDFFLLLVPSRRSTSAPRVLQEWLL